MCVNVHVCVHVHKRMLIPGILEDQGQWIPWHECEIPNWELNSGLQDKQCIFLTTEKSMQSKYI